MISIEEIKARLHKLETSGATQNSLVAFDLAGELNKMLADWDRGKLSRAKERGIEDIYRDLISECNTPTDADIFPGDRGVHAF